MSDWWALMWDVKPGSEEAVQELFKSYQSPDPVVKDEEGNEKGKLLRTVVFMKVKRSCGPWRSRGALPEVAAHLGRQPEIQDPPRRSSTRIWRSPATCPIPRAPASSSRSRSCNAGREAARRVIVDVHGHVTHPELFERFRCRPRWRTSRGCSSRRRDGIELTIVGSPVGFGTMVPVPGSTTTPSHSISSGPSTTGWRKRSRSTAAGWPPTPTRTRSAAPSGSRRPRRRSGRAGSSG